MAFINNLIYLDMELRPNIWWSGFFRTYVLNTDVVFVVLYCTVPYYFLLPRYKCCRLISKEGLCRVRIVLLHINVCHNCRWTLVSNSLKARYSLLLVLVTFSAQVWCWVRVYARLHCTKRQQYLTSKWFSRNLNKNCPFGGVYSLSIVTFRSPLTLTLSLRMVISGKEVPKNSDPKKKSTRIEVWIIRQIRMVHTN